MIIYPYKLLMNSNRKYPMLVVFVGMVYLELQVSGNQLMPRMLNNLKCRSKTIALNG